MSISFTGKLYDGETSASFSVLVTVDDSGNISLQGYEIPEARFDELQISDRIGNSPRFIDLDNGLRIETSANDDIDKLIEKWRPGRSGMAHFLESNMRAVAISLLVLVASGFLLVQYGIPAMSGYITALLPTSLDDQLGGEVLEQLDSFVFEPSTLSETRQLELRAYFSSLSPGNDRDFRLQFRNSELLGANAFALPNAEIVFTDQLIELADSDEMLGPIMLHEIGHVINRHAMRSVISQAGVSMLVFGLSGDVGSAATTLLVSLPSFLIQSSYSRDLEWEADSYALEQMQDRAMNPEDFANIMARILESDTQIPETQIEDQSSGESRSSFSQYFSSHPPTEERLARFRDAAAR